MRAGSESNQIGIEREEATVGEHAKMNFRNTEGSMVLFFMYILFMPDTRWGLQILRAYSDSNQISIEREEATVEEHCSIIFQGAVKTKTIAQVDQERGARSAGEMDIHVEETTFSNVFKGRVGQGAVKQALLLR